MDLLALVSLLRRVLLLLLLLLRLLAKSESTDAIPRTPSLSERRAGAAICVLCAASFVEDDGDEVGPEVDKRSVEEASSEDAGRKGWFQISRSQLLRLINLHQSSYPPKGKTGLNRS